MGYRWKPSKAQARAFAERMSDPAEQEAYDERKKEKAEKKRAGSRFDYGTAGGFYRPTQAQHDFCFGHMEVFTTPEEVDAANQVMFGWSCSEKVHHDYIHIVNEKRREYEKY